MTATLHDRFLARYRVQEDGCWVWTGSMNGHGYGTLYLGGRGPRTIGAHKYAFLALRGPYDLTLDLDHLCRNRACVNPDHLEPVTRQVNLNRSPIGNLAKTHCPHGHEYAGDNLIRDSRGSRFCRTCMNERSRAYKARKRSARRSPRP